MSNSINILIDDRIWCDLSTKEGTYIRTENLTLEQALAYFETGYIVDCHGLPF